MFSESFLPQVTERLIPRRFIGLNLERFVAYRQDPQVTRFQVWSTVSYAEAQSLIKEI